MDDGRCLKSEGPRHAEIHDAARRHMAPAMTPLASGGSGTRRKRECHEQLRLSGHASQASLVLPAEIAAAIIGHAQASYPEEVCGLVAGAAGRATMLYPGRNISPTPRVAYELDHDTLARMIDFEDTGLELIAIYHSHPEGPDTPSETDMLHAFYPEAVYLICSLADPDLPTLRGFRMEAGRFAEVPFDTPCAIG